MTRLTVRCMGPNETKTNLLWLCQLFNGNSYLGYSHVNINIYSIKLLLTCFPSKVVTRHTVDKPWVTNGLEH